MLIRGVVVDDISVVGGGKTESGIEEANLRIRCMYISIVLLA